MIGTDSGRRLHLPCTCPWLSPTARGGAGDSFPRAVHLHLGREQTVWCLSCMVKVLSVVCCCLAARKAWTPPVSLTFLLHTCVSPSPQQHPTASSLPWMAQPEEHMCFFFQVSIASGSPNPTSQPKPHKSAHMLQKIEKHYVCLVPLYSAWCSQKIWDGFFEFI